MALTSAPATNTAPPRDRHAWTLQDARSAIAASYPSTRDAGAEKSVAAYVQGEHYQKGAAWMGAGFPLDGSGLSDFSLSRINRMLTPVPEGFACIERRVDGACGNQASIDVQPKEPAGPENEDGTRGLSEEQERFRKEWKAQASAAWDEMQLWGGKDLRKPTGVRGMVAQASWSQTGSACLRFYVNPASRTLEVRVRDAGGAVTGTDRRVPSTKGDRAAALKHILVVAPPPERCCVYTDPDTQQKTGVFLFTNTDNVNCAEVWFAEGQTTVLRTITEGAEDRREVFPWGGLIPIVQADVGCIFTDAVRRLQGALDTAATSMLKNLLAHGYTQRTEVNAEDDGFWSTSPPAGIAVPRQREGDAGIEYFNPVSPDLDSNVIRKLVGIEHTTGKDYDKNTESFSLTNPTIDYHEPSSADSLIQGVDALTMILRTACHQGHVRVGLLGSTAEASGDAYEQARAAFVSDINGVGEAVDGPLAAGLTAMTVMADWLAGEDTPTFLNEWTVVVQSHPNAGNPSTEFQRVTLEMVQGELLSAEEGTARLGVQDVAGERTRVLQERTWKALTVQATWIATMIGAGMDRKAVLMEAGYSEKDAVRLIQSDGLTGIEQ